MREIKLVFVPLQVVSMVSVTFIILSVMSLCFYSMLLHEHEKKQTTKTTNTTKTIEKYGNKNISSKQGSSTVEITHVISLIVLDLLCFIWFTIEFTLRFIATPSRRSFITKFMNLIDLVTIVPYFIQFAYTRANPTASYISEPLEGLQIISILRLVKLFRFFRLSRGLQILVHTMIASSRELLLLLLLLSIPVVMFSTIVYYCERKVSEYCAFQSENTL